MTGLLGAAEAGSTEPVRAALTETGAIGATVLQIAHRLRAAPAQVEATLDDLERTGDVLRMGRGLWVLRAFEALAERDDFAGPELYVDRFARENGIRIGSYSGPITFRSNEALPIHRWWPFVQGYSAEFVRAVLDRAELPRGASVLDPFAGSGTTLVEARRAGTRPLGTELLAPAVLAARVKTRFELPAAELAAAGAQVIRRARRRGAGAWPFLRETRRQFSASALAALTRLRDALPPEGTPAADAVRLAFGRILIPSSRLHRSPCLGYARGASDEGPGPFDRFEAAIEVMREDLGTLADERARWGPPATVAQQDARVGLPGRGTVALVVTSPPYVNGMDYVMNYKLDLAWLGYAQSYRDLAAVRSAEVACDNLPRAETAPFVAPSSYPESWLAEILPRLRENVRRKGTYRRGDAHAIVHRYFADLERVLVGVRRSLRPGGRAVFVVGDSLLAGAYVPGDLILARIAERRGLAIDSVDVARRRRSGQRRSFALRETVVTLSKPRAAG